MVGAPPPKAFFLVSHRLCVCVCGNLNDLCWLRIIACCVLVRLFVPRCVCRPRDKSPPAPLPCCSVFCFSTFSSFATPPFSSPNLRHFAAHCCWSWGCLPLLWRSICQRLVVTTFRAGKCGEMQGRSGARPAAYLITRPKSTQHKNANQVDRPSCLLRHDASFF